MTPFLDELARNVSHGIQKKTMLIRELVHDPEVLILDEPTGYMDAESNRITWDLLKKLKRGKTIIYVSNSLPEVEQAHDRILVFRNGRIMKDGHIDTLLKSTLEYHKFQIGFHELSDDLYKTMQCVHSSLAQPVE